MCKSIADLSIIQLELMQDTAEAVFNRHIQEFITAKMQSWQEFVRGELARGGGLLFKYIAKEDKAFLKIDLAKFGGSDFNPSEVLANQSDSWSQYWAPKGVEGEKIKSACHECMAIFRSFAMPPEQAAT